MFNLNNSNWYGNAVDWIGDAIEAIGYHCGFDEKEIDLKVKNFRVAIPSGMESIEYITHEGLRLPLGVDQSDYGFVRTHTGSRPNLLTYEEALELGKYIDNLNALREMDPTVPGVVEQIANMLFLINGIIGTGTLAGHLHRWNHHFYTIESETQYIKTSFENGLIKVRCRMFKVDREGLPLILNTYKYKEAISWFIISRLLLRGDKHPVLTWEKANDEWDGQFGFRLQASNEGKMMSPDQMERFRQRWTSIKRDTYASQY